MSAGGDAGLTYAASGVDIDAGERAVTLMRSAVERTNRPEVVGGLGGFAGLFALDTAKYRKPLLASSTDGVGTKLKLAMLVTALGLGESFFPETLPAVLVPFTIDSTLDSFDMNADSPMRRMSGRKIGSDAHTMLMPACTVVHTSVLE